MGSLKDMSEESKINFCDDVRSIISKSGGSCAVSSIPANLRMPEFLGGPKSGRTWKNLPVIEEILIFLEGRGFVVSQYSKRIRKISF